MNRKLHMMDRVTDDYLDLIRKFPLRPIKNEAEQKQATKIMLELAAKAEDRLTPGQADYLDGLSDFVDAYDRQHHPVERPDLDAIDYLRFLLDENAMNASDLGRLLGNRTLGSAILGRTRQLSKAHILKLAERFRVNPALFLK